MRSQLVEHRHKGGLVHRHAQWDGEQHEHSGQAMTEAGLGDDPSGPVVPLRLPEGETDAITRVASTLAQIIEDEGRLGPWIVAQAAHDAILMRSRIIREHALSLQSKSEANALAYLSHLIGEAVRTARG